MPIKFDLTHMRKKYNLTTFFETGLFKGASIKKALEAGFKKCISIEISTKHYTTGLKTFQEEIERGSVMLFKDDSKNMKQYLKYREGNTFFWLDAHADQNSNHERGEELCPIFQELQSINEILTDDDVISIDDVRLLKTNSAWGKNIKYENLINKLKDMGRSKIEFENGIINGDVLVAYP